MGRLQHVLHNALQAWTSPAGTYEWDMIKLRDGRYRIEETGGLWSLIQKIAREVGLEEVKGTVLVQKHPGGAELLIKIVSNGKCAFARVRYHQPHRYRREMRIDIL